MDPNYDEHSRILLYPIIYYIASFGYIMDISYIYIMYISYDMIYNYIYIIYIYILYIHHIIYIYI